MKILPLFSAVLLSMTLAGNACAQPTMFKHQQKGISCEQCHKTNAPAGAPKNKVCFQCHSYEQVAKASAAKGMPLNPHDSHAGQLRCTLCHQEHQQSRLHCRECHKNQDDKRFDMQVP